MACWDNWWFETVVTLQAALNRSPQHCGPISMKPNWRDHWPLINHFCLAGEKKNKTKRKEKGKQWEFYENVSGLCLFLIFHELSPINFDTEILFKIYSENLLKLNMSVFILPLFGFWVCQLSDLFLNFPFQALSLFSWNIIRFLSICSNWTWPSSSSIILCSMHIEYNKNNLFLDILHWIKYFS